MSYLYYLYLFVHSGIQHVLTMSSIAGVLSIRDRVCLLFASTCMVHPLFIWGKQQEVRTNRKSFYAENVAEITTLK
jgi:hypothetical protein